MFTEDVVIDMSEEGAGIRHRPRAKRSCRCSPGHYVRGHHGHMPEIELTSPTTAKGIWAMEDRVWWPAGRTGPISRGRAITTRRTRRPPPGGGSRP